MDNSLLTQHLRAALLSWLIGGVIGGSLGALFALALRWLCARLPVLRGLMALLPWRSVVGSLLLMLFVFVARRGVFVNMFHLAGMPVAFTLQTFGGEVVGFLVSLAIFLLALPVLAGALLEYWRPTPLGARLIALGRSLALVALGATLVFDFFGGPGLGAFLSRRLGLLDLPVALDGLFRVIGLLLVVDILLGILQMSAFFILGGRAGRIPTASAPATIGDAPITDE
jgi:hypothetical protein